MPISTDLDESSTRPHQVITARHDARESLAVPASSVSFFFLFLFFFFVSFRFHSIQCSIFSFGPEPGDNPTASPRPTEMERSLVCRLRMATKETVADDEIRRFHRDPTEIPRDQTSETSETPSCRMFVHYETPSISIAPVVRLHKRRSRRVTRTERRKTNRQHKKKTNNNDTTTNQLLALGATSS